MRKIILLGSMLLFAAPTLHAAQAKNDWPTSIRDAKTFVADMPSDAWVKIMQASLSLKFFIGKPIVAVFNTSDEELVTITCDNKWVLVGANPYLKDAPRSIPAHTVGFIPTAGFDQYCTRSIIGITDSGTQHTGTLSIPGDFTHSTAIYFH